MLLFWAVWTLNLKISRSYWVLAWHMTGWDYQITPIHFHNLPTITLQSLSGTSTSPKVIWLSSWIRISPKIGKIISSNLLSVFGKRITASNSVGKTIVDPLQGEFPCSQLFLSLKLVECFHFRVLVSLPLILTTTDKNKTTTDNEFQLSGLWYLQRPKISKI